MENVLCDLITTSKFVKKCQRLTQGWVSTIITFKTGLENACQVLFVYLWYMRLHCDTTLFFNIFGTVYFVLSIFFLLASYHAIINAI